MKRIGLYIGLMALGSLEVTAQVATATHTAVEAIGETQAKIWGLDSCMAYAVEHATDVKREVVNARQRKQDYQKAVTDFLPSVAGGVQGQYAWGRNIDPETNTYNHVTTFNNYYQLYASLNVFDGFATINAFKQAKLARAYSTTAMQKASDKLAESKRLLGKMQRLYELGEKGRPDVVQMESQVAEDEYNLTHQKHVAQQSLLTLKSAMNFPVEEELRLVTNGKQVNESFPINHETVYQNFLNASPDVKSAEYEVEKARYDYKIAKGRLLPSLSLSGGISTNFYRNLSQGGQYEGFASQFRNNRGEYLALTLSIPIYDNVAWHSVKKARNDWQLAQVNLEETKRKLHDHIAQAVMDAEEYVKELYQMNKKVASDSLAYYMSSRKFEEGMLSTFDLHTAAQTLLESRIKQLQMQMLLVIKQRLVDYYQGKNLIK